MKFKAGENLEQGDMVFIENGIVKKIRIKEYKIKFIEGKIDILIFAYSNLILAFLAIEVGFIKWVLFIFSIIFFIIYFLKD